MASRAHLAVDIHAALVIPQKSLRIVAVQGEQGIGKSQLIAEWWQNHGRKQFNKNVIALDCSRRGGDKIVEALNRHFLNLASDQLTEALSAQINARERVAIILDGLSHDESAPTLVSSNAMITTGQADKATLRRIRELLIFFANSGVTVSVLLGIQTAEETVDALEIDSQLDASAHLKVFRVQRLTVTEGAQLVQYLGIRNLSFPDLMHLSDRLQGLPISLVAVAHYLRTAEPRQAEAFLIEVDNRGHKFRYFEEFFGRYLDALNHGNFDETAHPQAYLRLLALMPGPVAKSQIDDLLKVGRIVRLEKASTAHFHRMRIAFVIDKGEYIDVNPMIRGLLRQEIARGIRRDDGSITTDRDELWFIHGSAARWCLNRLPRSTADFSAVEIEIIEGAIYHLLAMREYVQIPDTNDANAQILLTDLDCLLRPTTTPAQLTQYCLERLVRRFLNDRAHRATTYLGQFETKARVLSLFFEEVDNSGQPRHLSLWEQAEVCSEMGVCWMHAGRLQLAQQALEHARRCLCDLGINYGGESDGPAVTLAKDTSRLWSETLSTYALILMRLGRRREEVDDTLAEGVAVARLRAEAALAPEAALNAEDQTFLLSARRLITRSAQVAFNAGDLPAAESGYALASDIERLVWRRTLTGDALQRQIAVLVRRGPCISDDLTLAENMIDEQLEPRRGGGRRRRSNDVIPMYSTKIMVLRARGEFLKAREYLDEALAHPFVVRGECTFVARMELELERYRLMIAFNDIEPRAPETLALIIKELEARHHWLLCFDAQLLQAEMLPEPARSQTLDRVERQCAAAQWQLRRLDIEIIRDGGSAVMTMGC